MWTTLCDCSWCPTNIACTDRLAQDKGSDLQRNWNEQGKYDPVVGLLPLSHVYIKATQLAVLLCSGDILNSFLELDLCYQPGQLFTFFHIDRITNTGSWQLPLSENINAQNKRLEFLCKIVKYQLNQFDPVCNVYLHFVPLSKKEI